MRIVIKQVLDHLSRYSLELGQTEALGQPFPTADYAPLARALAVLRDAPDFPREQYDTYRAVFKGDPGLDAYLIEHGFPMRQIGRRFAASSVVPERGKHAPTEPSRVTEPVTAEEQETLRTLARWLQDHSEVVRRITKSAFPAFIFPNIDKTAAALDKLPSMENPERGAMASALALPLAALGRAVPSLERPLIMAGARALGAIAERGGSPVTGLQAPDQITDPLVEATKEVTSGYRLSHVAIHGALDKVDSFMAAFYRGRVMGSEFPPSTLYDLITSSDDYAAEIAQAHHQVTRADRHVHNPVPEFSQVLPEFLFELLAHVIRRLTKYGWNPAGQEIKSKGQAFRRHLEAQLKKEGSSGGHPMVHQGPDRHQHRSHVIHHHGPSVENMHGVLFRSGMAFAGMSGIPEIMLEMGI